MRKIFLSILVSILILYSFFFIQKSNVNAQTDTPPPIQTLLRTVQPTIIVITPTPTPATTEVTTKARVGDFLITVSGAASINAKVTLYDLSDLAMATHSATLSGEFTFPNIPIRKGLSGFCFDTIDSKKWGESLGCFLTDPIFNNAEFKDMYLPPTITLSKDKLDVGGTTLIYGFSMPAAKIIITTDKGKQITTTADDTGYYQYKWENLAAGKYVLTATGIYDKKRSLSPKYSVKLLVGSTGITVTSEKKPGISSTLLIIIGLVVLIIILSLGISAYLWYKKNGSFALSLNLRQYFQSKHPLHDDWLLEFLNEKR